MNKGDRFTVVVLGYMMKLPDAAFRPSALCQHVTILTLLTRQLINSS